MSSENTIRLASRFDYSYHREFNEAYVPLLDEPTVKKIVLDFSTVQYIDSSALGMMVLLQKKALNVGKAVVVKSAKGEAAEILRMANMQKLFEFL